MARKRKKYRAETDKIQKFLGKLVLAIVKHLFLDCLIIFLLTLILGSFFYYKYNILAQRVKLESFEKPFLLKEDDYQNVIKIWQEDERRFKEADSKEYINPFKEQSTVVPEEVPGSES